MSNTNFENKSVHEKKQIVRRKILDNSIREDKNLVSEQWVNTIFHRGDNGTPNEKAVTAILFCMACVAAGTFEISLDGKSGEPGEWIKPYNSLSVADYFSHGSRVMIDLEGLLQENIAIFWGYFEGLASNANGRSSTHKLERNNGQLVEKKLSVADQNTLAEGFKTLINAIGEYKLPFFNTTFNRLVKGSFAEGPRLANYGVDIMMGGVNQPNLIGEMSHIGYDGHLYMYLGEKDAVMIGLEQTNPITAKKVSLEENPHTGLASPHSLLGNSDEYTAAGSLYFSNLIYQAKLFDEQGILVPSKYNGMRVRFANDEEFNEANENLVTLFNKIINNNPNIESNKRCILDFLNKCPKNIDNNDTRSIEDKKQHYIKQFIDSITDDSLYNFFKQLETVYEENNAQLQKDNQVFATKLSKIKHLQAFLESDESNQQQSLSVELFDESHIEYNPHIKRLGSIFNLAINCLEKKAIEKLKSWRANPGKEFKDIDVITTAYKDFYSDNHNFIGNESKIKSIIAYIESLESVVSSNTCANSNDYEIIQTYTNPFDAWYELQLISKFYKSQTTSCHNTVIIAMANQINQKPVLREVEKLALDDVTPTTPDPAKRASQATWDFSFLMHCLLSPMALKGYGVVLIIAACIAVTAVCMGVVPVVIGSTVALSASITATACFFYAKPDAAQVNQKSVNNNP